MEADHPSYPPSGYASLVQLLVRLEDLCMAESWNSRMIEGQLRRTGQVVLAIQADGQVHCFFTSLRQNGPERSEAMMAPSLLSFSDSEMEICGYIWFEDRSIVDEATEASWELLRIGIIPSFRNRSMGSALLQKGLEFLSQQRHYRTTIDPGSAASRSSADTGHLRESTTECDRILLEVAETNSAARKLYESFGFNVIHRRKNYYADSDALIMERPGGNVQ